MTASIATIIQTSTDWTLSQRSTETLRAKLKQHGCYIYGAGGFGRQVAAACAAQGIEVKGFVDTFVGGGQMLAGVPSVKPNEFNPDQALASVLVIAVNNYAVELGGIADWAKQTGFADVLFVPELPDVLGPSLGQYWQSTRTLMSEHVPAIERFHDMLTDDISRGILRDLVRYRITGRPEHHPPADIDNHYLPIDLPMPAKEVSIIDCGAYPGDMVDRTKAAGLKLRNWFAFEPDPANFRKLSEVASASPIQSASLFPCGVGNSTAMVRFDDGGAASSKVANDQDSSTGVMVQLVRVDEVVQAERIDLVKLDIEGFEIAAMEGMAGLLARHKPRIAAAIYHKPTDLWEIAFQVQQWFPGTRFAIRQHGWSGYETVLYADLAS